MDKSQLTQSRDTNGSHSGFETPEPLSDAIRYWERGRIIYDLVLVTIVLAWVVTTWPHFSEAPRLQALLFLVIFAAMANLL